MLDTDGYRRNLTRFIAFRWLASGVVAVVLVVGAVRLPDFNMLPAVGVALLIPLSNLVHIRLAAKPAWGRRALLAQFAIDLVLLTALLGTLGGIDGPTIALYLFHVLLAALLLPRRDALITAGAVVGLSATMAILQAIDAPFPFPHRGYFSCMLGVPGPAPPVFIFSQIVGLTVVSSVMLLLVLPLTADAREQRRTAMAAQEVAERRAEALETLLDNLGAMMLVLDTEHRVEWANRRVAEQFPGIKVGEIRRCYDPAEPMGGGEAHAPQCPSCRVLASGERWQGDFTLAEPGGGQRVLRVYATPHGSDGTVDHVEELILDVTEERRTERQLNDARKSAAVAGLAAGVAHEMNTPLASIGAGLRSLRRVCEAAVPAETSAHTRTFSILADLSEQTERCQRITKSMLGYAREAKVNLGTAEVTAVVHGALEELGSRRNLTGIEVVFENPTQPVGAARCDPEQLRLALVNILTNAVDAVTEAHRNKPRIHIRAAPGADNATVEIHIKDNGRGIASHAMDRIFDPFFTTKPAGSGTGLGLPVTQGLLAKMGAAIEVDSELDAGTHVTVRLGCTDSSSDLHREGGPSHDNAGATTHHAG